MSRMTAPLLEKPPKRFWYKILYLWLSVCHAKIKSYKNKKNKLIQKKSVFSLIYLMFEVLFVS